jgi:hypothetical protein
MAASPTMGSSEQTQRLVDQTATTIMYKLIDVNLISLTAISYLTIDFVTTLPVSLLHGKRE